jgi:hypothetical protein
MALLQKSIRVLGKAMPKVASPKTHAVLDYATAVIFLAGAVFFWRRNRRAAVASLICGAAGAGVAALTDYPGGIKRAISFPLHQKLDLGLSSMAATMPGFLGFDDEKEKSFFRLQSVVIAGAAAITEFEARRIAEDSRAA